MIPVTKPYFPSRAKLDRYIDGIYERKWLTNNGPLTQQFTERLQSYLGVKNLLLVNNGTLALQVAYSALDVKQQGAEAVTTPFSFVATTSSLKWEGINPIFSDIDGDTFCLKSSLLDRVITKKIRAIVPVHVFGNACEVETIQNIASKHKIKTIYDGAHAFGVQYKGESLLNYGDATTLSFHATKLFHSVEGGAIIFRHKTDLEKAKNIINFGIEGPESINGLGINAKMNEFQAAMGLCVLDDMNVITARRAEIWHTYEKKLKHSFQLQQLNPNATNNYAYFPMVFESEQALLKAKIGLSKYGIQPRRYFYPSLDELDYLQPQTPQHVSRSLADRILCLPIYLGLGTASLNKIINQLLRA